MTIQEFSNLLDFLKTRKQIKYREEYYIYLSKDLKKGFADTILKPHSKGEFDYVIPLASYWATIDKWNGYWLHDFGFYDNCYNPCEIIFKTQKGEAWKLYDLKDSVIAGTERFAPIFKLRNESETMTKEICCEEYLPDFNKSLILLYNELNDITC